MLRLLLSVFGGSPCDTTQKFNLNFFHPPRDIFAFAGAVICHIESTVGFFGVVLQIALSRDNFS